MIRTSTKPLRPSSLAGPALAGIAALALLSGAPATAQEADEPDKEMTKGEEKLSRLLEGRVAGEPQDCVRDFANNRVMTIDETAIVYGRGRTIYVQRTRSPERIDRDDILVVRRFGGTQICRMDFINTVDRYSGFFTGGIQFDKFIPYTRVDEEEL
ncbi:MAG: hypothetical protein AAFY42_02275 [Pseudomonadota bacterium]